MNNHQHGPGCNHSHQSAGHSHGPPNMMGVNSRSMTTQQYFRLLKSKWQNKRQFFWCEVFIGDLYSKLMQALKLDFLKNIHNDKLNYLLGGILMMCTMKCIPTRARAFTVSLFYGLVAFVLFNLTLLYGLQIKNIEKNKVGSFIILLPIILFVISGLRGSGQFSLNKYGRMTKEKIKVRPYLDNPQIKCKQCNLLKVFRSAHCPICDFCVPKVTRHSVVFNQCIGAANELPVMLFFFSVGISSLFFILSYANLEQKSDTFTSIFAYTVNVILIYQGLMQGFTILVLNMYYGLTENQFRTWMMQKYLMKLPGRQYQNSFNISLMHQLKQSWYAFINKEGFQSQGSKKKFMQVDDRINPQFQQLDQNKKYVVNWCKAFFVVIPEIPNHKQRNFVIQMMRRQEPKMIENYKLSLEFKRQIEQECKGKNVSEMEMQSRLMFKMQQHMMKQQNQMAKMMAEKLPPPTEEQKNAHIRVFENIKRDIAGFPEQQLIGNILQKLKSNTMTLFESNMELKQIQQSIMKRKMEQMIAESQRKKQPEPVAQVMKERNDEEEERLKPSEQSGQLILDQ